MYKVTYTWTSINYSVSRTVTLKEMVQIRRFENEGRLKIHEWKYQSEKELTNESVCQHDNLHTTTK